MNQPPQKKDVQNYMSSDQNVVWQELLRRKQTNAVRQSKRFTLPQHNPDSKGEDIQYCIVEWITNINCSFVYMMQCVTHV